MKVAYVCFCDNKGGAARGAFRLFKGLRESGLDVTMIVRRKYSDEADIEQYDLPLSPKKQAFNAWVSTELYPQLRAQQSGYQSFCLRYTGLDKYLNEKQFDLVLLHWIGGDTISIKELANIKAPMLWRLADEWAFSGSLHYVEDTDESWCDQYPLSSLTEDANAFIWNRKLRFWKNLNVQFIAGSRWLTEKVKISRLFSHCSALAIPSSLETDVFKPLDDPCDFLMRQGFEFHSDKVYILFGAAHANTDMRKGFDLCINAVNRMTQSHDDIEVIVFGNDDVECPPNCQYPVHYLGNINNNAILAALYSLARVTVVSSRVDNLPFAAMESLACGTQVVGFEIGGMPDIVNHPALGRLVSPFDVAALSEAIEALVNQPKNQISIDSCRNKALNEYAINVQVQRYLTVINQAVKEEKNAQ